MVFLSFRNGTAHLLSETVGFGGTVTWKQIDLATRLQLHASPAVLARGMLGMMRYGATKTLSGIKIPTLVVAGDRDPVTLPLASNLLYDSIPLAELKVLAPARHMGLIEHHVQYAREVRDFLNRVTLSPVWVG